MPAKVRFLSLEQLLGPLPGLEGTLIQGDMSLLDFLKWRTALQDTHPATAKPSVETRQGSGPTTLAITVPFDVDASRETDKTWLAACKRQFVIVVMKRFETQAKGVEVLRARGSGMTTATLCRWGRSRS